jgi:hypothetical protein
MIRLTSRSFAFLAVAVLTASPAAAQNRSQLAAAAGVSAQEAEGMTLSELFARKINRENGRDGQVTVSTHNYPVFEASDHAALVANAGLTRSQATDMDLSQIAAHKNNRGATRDNRIPVTQMASASFDAADHPQLVASAGLSASEAQAMSLNEIYRHKHNRSAGRDEVQGVRR